MDKKFEKDMAKEILNLINQYNKLSDKKEVNKKLNELTHELYYKKQNIISQKMIDLALAILSFTTASLNGGHYQDLTEFIPDLEEIINS